MEPPRLPDAGQLFREHGDFVWRLLHRLGVQNSDLPDMAQEVFMVVHRRRDSFTGESAVTSWLFGICLRVASDYRRKAARKKELPTAPDALPLGEDAQTPERALSSQRARRRLEAALDAMPLDRRAVFTLFELEGMSCERIAAMMEVPVGTIYSRLHKARLAFTRALESDDE